MSPPRILVYAPDVLSPSGGVRKLYRHVDVLNRHGFAAAVVHQKDGFRCTWFANDTPVVYTSTTPVSRADVLVFPEVYGAQTAALAPGVPRVLFNQNAYLTFTDYPADGRDLPTPYTGPDLLAALVVSEDSRAYLRHVFPDLRIFRLRYGIDPGLFAYAPAKRRAIAYMPRKNRGDVVQVLQILRCRGALGDFELVPIEKRPEAEVAALLKECLVFLSFGHPEGFGLPPAEALACGCLVVGYHGGGGREYFEPAGAYPIDAGDVVGFARTVEELLRAYRENPVPLRERAERGAAWVRAHYSPRQEEEDIVTCWQTILGPP
jgi:glycosyltransferase involved in cell wall biosynthesis